MSEELAQGQCHMIIDCMTMVRPHYFAEIVLSLPLDHGRELLVTGESGFTLSTGWRVRSLPRDSVI